MKLQVAFILECGQIVHTPDTDYFWNEEDTDNNEIEAARYDSFISFNKPGNKLFCKKHDDMHRIRRININVAEFDTGVLS